MIPNQLDRYSSHTIGGINKQRTGKLSSHLSLLNNKLQERLEIAQGKSYRSWKRYFGMLVQTHKQVGITWTVLKEPFDKGVD